MYVKLTTYLHDRTIIYSFLLSRSTAMIRPGEERLSSLFSDDNDDDDDAILHEG